MGAEENATPRRRYRRIAELGRGGMASVFLASLGGPGDFTKLVVVKEMRKDLAESPEFVRMFLEEARVAARLNHPNVVHTFEVVDEPELSGIVMEFLDGQPLHRVRAAMRGELLLPLQIHVISQALAGLDYVHEVADYDGAPLSLVHRDVSPQNIFVTYNGDVKVLDFGIAKANDSSLVTQTGTLKGKVAYMAPEQLRGEPTDRRADIYAMGVVLWEAATGKRMWAGQPEAAVFAQVLAGKVARPSEVAPVARELDRICMRALAFDPADRYADAGEFIRDLDSYARTTLEPAGRRELSAVMTGLFAEARERVRRQIEHAMRARAETPPTIHLVADTGEHGSLPVDALVAGAAEASGARSPTTGVTSTRVETRARVRSAAGAWAPVVVGALLLGGVVGGGVALMRRAGGPPSAGAPARDGATVVQAGSSAQEPPSEPAPAPSASAPTSSSAPSASALAPASAPSSSAPVSANAPKPWRWPPPQPSASVPRPPKKPGGAPDLGY
jgi:eukaryotic-like serine/threonine-protein kinase